MPTETTENNEHNPDNDNISLFFAGSAFQPALLPENSLPAEIAGQKCYYFWKDVICVGEYEHPTEHWKLDVTPERLQHWYDIGEQMLSVGDPIPINCDHSDSAYDTQGYVKAFKVDHDRLLCYCQFIGDEAALLAAKNFVSVGVYKKIIDGEKREWTDAIQHIALTSDPVVGNQGHFASKRIVLFKEQTMSEANDTKDTAATVVDAVTPKPEPDKINLAKDSWWNTPSVTPAQLITGGIGTAVGGGLAASHILDPFISQSWNAVEPYIGNVFNTIADSVEAIPSLVNSGVKTIESGWDTVEPLLEKGWDAVTGLFSLNCDPKTLMELHATVPGLKNCHPDDYCNHICAHIKNMSNEDMQDAELPQDTDMSNMCMSKISERAKHNRTKWKNNHIAPLAQETKEALTEAFETKLDVAFSKGAIDKITKQKLSDLFVKSEGNVLAFSKVSGQSKSLAINVIDILANNRPIEINEKSGIQVLTRDAENTALTALNNYGLKSIGVKKD